MAEIFRVENLEEAISLATQFKSHGVYDLFRGQAKNWPIVPSAGRLSIQDYEENLKKLGRLNHFFKTEPLLEKYASDIDWFYAVAQHYNIATYYIDFTTSVEVAAFFATNSESNKLGQECVIICINGSNFTKWVELTASFVTKIDVPPYIAKINVDNLWRLQSQKGCFLYTPYSNIEDIFPFDRIAFPFANAYTGLLKSEIYPERKSELEILLDHYFNREKRIKLNNVFEQFKKEIKGFHFFEMQHREHSNLLKQNTYHISWHSSNYQIWNFMVNEEWESNPAKLIEIDFPFNLSLQDQIDTISHQLQIYFNEHKINRLANLCFYFKPGMEAFYEIFTKISNTCVRIWDGTRGLPYSDKEICAMIGKYICFEFHVHLYDKVPSSSLEEILVLELTNATGSITRCCATPSKVAACFREDLQSILIDELVGLESCELLFHINNPRVIFDFDKLTKLFADELVVYQVLHNSEEKNPVVFYTPTQITVLGYA